MKRLLAWIVNKIDTLSKWSGYILSGLVIVMGLIITYEVVARYFFNNPTNWAMELATMLFGTYMLGGGAWTLYRKAHVKMDIFYNKWRPRTRAIIDVLTFPFFLLFFSIMLWKSGSYGMQSVYSLEHSHTAWGPPIYHWKMTLPGAVFLIILQGLADFIRNLYCALTSEEL